MNQGPSLNEYVHPSLVDAAQQTSKAMSDFGVASEELLMRHGKKIVDKQFHLWRLADAAIDIYGMVATLSRSVIIKEVKRGNLPFTPSVDWLVGWLEIRPLYTGAPLVKRRSTCRVHLSSVTHHHHQTKTFVENFSSSRHHRGRNATIIIALH